MYNGNVYFGGGGVSTNIIFKKVAQRKNSLMQKGRNNMINGELVVLCQDLVQVKMRNFSHFNLPEAQPQCSFFHTLVRIRLATYSCNGYEFVSYCRKLPDIQKSTGMLAYNHGF